jgi:hypothetical protein
MNKSKLLESVSLLELRYVICYKICGHTEKMTNMMDVLMNCVDHSQWW